MNGYDQYIADSKAIEAFFPMPIVKEAGILDAMKTAKDVIMNQVNKKVEEEGVIGALTTYLVHGAVFKLWSPWGSLILMAAEYLGLSPGRIINQIVSFVSDAIKNGKTISIDELNAKGKEIVSQEAAEPTTAHLELDQLIKLAKPPRRSSSSFGRSRFGLLGRRSIVAGIIFWLVKTVLIGAGAVTLTGAVKDGFSSTYDKAKENYGLFDGSDENKEETSWFKKPTERQSTMPPIQPHSLTPSGEGELYHENEGHTTWYVPLVANRIKSTLVAWAVNIYPELKGHEKAILSSRSFNTLASLLERCRVSEAPNHIVMPIGIHTRKELVDRFVGDAAQKIKA